MNLTEIRQVLAEENVTLTKALGQNFLHDANQLRRIVAIAELEPDDQIVEIGPGLGALTHPLLQKTPHLLAIEKDRRLFDYLNEHYRHTGLQLLHADALEYIERQQPDWTGWKLVSNLPYSVASPILVELGKSRGAPQRIVVTLQLEVAQRLAAKADENAYGVLSLLMQLRYQPGPWFIIPAVCFFPVPEIDSACIRLERRTTDLLEPSLHRGFEKIVKRGFSQRRKMMLKLLKADWPMPALEKAFAELGLSPQVRAEAVTLEQFVQLTKLLNTQPAAPQGKL